MLEKRKSSRRKMVLPVKCSIDKVTHLAHTIDITHTGGRIGGLRTELQPGMIISLQRGSNKAKFRIAWIRKVAPNELQARRRIFGDAEQFSQLEDSQHAHDRLQEGMAQGCDRGRAKIQDI